MLKSLTVKGFRGFADAQTLRLAIPNGTFGSGLTIIVGPNNSGKSSLLEPFKFRGRHNPSFHVGMRNQKSDFVKLTFEFDDRTEILESLEKGSSETKSENLNSRDQRAYFVPSRRHISHFFGRSGVSNRQDFMRNYLGSSGDRTPQVENFENRVYQLHREKDSFNPFIKKIVPDFMDWAIDQDHTGTNYIKMWTEEKTHSSAGAGEGIVSAIVLSAAFYDSEPGECIVIDEPELSLHPQVQRRLMNVLTELSADRQIVFATHSPYFLTREAILGGCKIIRTWDRKGEIELWQTSVTKCASLRSLVSLNVNNPHRFGLDAREAFFLDDGVLVLEGQEDVVLWPDAVSEAITYEVFGWGAGGASNIRDVLAVLSAMGFERVAAVVDNDRPDDAAALARHFPKFMVRMLPAPDIRTKAAVAAKEEKVGLLDGRSVRPEFRDAFTSLKSEVSEFLSPRRNT